jgi:ribosome-associated protein
MVRKLADIMAEQARNDADDRDLRSRTDARYERLSQEQTLVRLGKELALLSARKLAQLELPEAVLDAISDAQAISSAAARNRQLKVVRSRLREVDWASIQKRLETLLRHGTTKLGVTAPPPVEPPKADWVERLINEGAEALEAFLSQHPAADRSQLRQLIRNVQKIRSAQKATAALRTKASEKLRQAVETARNI